MKVNVSRGVIDLVYEALPVTDGVTPKALHELVDMWSLVTIRHALQMLCDDRRAVYEGEPMYRRYRMA